MRKYNLIESTASILKSYQSDYGEDTPQFKDLSKTSNNPLLNFKETDLPFDMEKLSKIKNVKLPKNLSDEFVLVDKKDAKKVSNYID